MSMPIAGIGDYFSPLQVIPVILLIVVIIFWRWYRSKQM